MQKIVFRSCQKFFNVQIEAYTILSNHFHFILRQSSDNVGIQCFMSRSQQVFSLYYNKRHRRTGPVFDGRYNAKLIDDDKYYANIWNYILNNPIKP
ncbi:transposase [Patescibacteria group bacterium]|nr:transposase [Patescibacteria group bacterium]